MIDLLFDGPMNATIRIVLEPFVRNCRSGRARASRTQGFAVLALAAGNT